jgi:hypothetical protein
MTPGLAPRPRCSVFIAVSVDGFIARTDGSLEGLPTPAGPEHALTLTGTQSWPTGLTQLHYTLSPGRPDPA